ncbi:MAG TPA: YihY/virulence factor BrkB family protein [Alphaproteobacteria bacterium]|nr:YihY/virulence factor BrkB family protein [Alphaproteobacteria bacterium]
MQFETPTETNPPSTPAQQVAKGFNWADIVAPWKEMLQRRGLITLHYLTKTEAHTYAFSVAANAILSFFPFMALMLWLIRNVLHSPSMFNMVLELLRTHLPAGQEAVVAGLITIARAGKRVHVASLAILLITSTGVFLPLEVAFNRIWGFTKNRSYLSNQLVSLALAFACGVLALISVALAAGNRMALAFVLRGTENIIFKGLMFVVVQLLATAASIAIFFLIYWILPHGKISARSVLPSAVLMGVLWELAKYAYMFALPWLSFREVYGPFAVSVTLIFWAFLSGLMMLAGAHLAADSSSRKASSQGIGRAL